MKICLCGYYGRMGQRILPTFKNENYTVVGIDCIEAKGDDKVYDDFNKCLLTEKKIDVLIDFSNYKYSYDIITMALNNRIKVISGTTGFTKKQIKKMSLLAKAKQTSFVWSPNFAHGAIVFFNEVKRLMKHFKNIDLIESHYKTKIDKPSGTAKALADLLKVPYSDVQVLRIHNKNAKHEVVLQNEFEKFTISYEVINDEAFISGFFKEFSLILNDKVIINNGFKSR